jgi:integration host factor subunit alpha
MHAAGELELSVAEHTVDASQRTVQRTVTRVDLAEAVYRCVGLSRKESAILVQSVLDELADALIGGESIKLSPRHGVQAIECAQGPDQWSGGCR